MRPPEQQLHRIRCSAKSLHQMRNSCAHKELQFHGVEDGSELGEGALPKAMVPAA
jgi:hypothetical protein